MEQEKKPIVELRNASFTYDPGTNKEVRALDDVSLKIFPGEYTAFFGPSGCGKTSLLYAVAGIEKPQTGSVWIDGKNILTLSPTEIAIMRQTKIGIVFQNFNLIPTITVLENVALPMAFLGIPDHDAKKRAQELLMRFGLDHLAVRYPNELSGGQQQRVSIARSLANDPLVILADEPMGNLDTTNAKIVLDQLRELNEKDGKTIIMVTHEVWTLRDVRKIFYVRDGKIMRMEERAPSKDAKLPAEKSVEEITLEKNPFGESPEKDAVPEGKEGGTGDSHTLSKLKALYPELKMEDVRIKALGLLLLEGYPEQTRARFESFLKKRLHGLIEPGAFKRLLDTPFLEGGAGLWKTTSEILAKKCDGFINEWRFADKAIAKLEHHPKTLLAEETKTIRRWILEDTTSISTSEDTTRFDEITGEKLREIITWENFEKVLALPKKSGGLGLRGQTPHRITAKFQTLLADEKVLKEQHSRTTS